jgi:CBS domain containing-hemolysin-like protein
MDVLDALGKLAAIFALVFLNGFFVAAEFAIVKVRSTQIEPLVKKGSRRARLAQNVITHLDTYLSATQLGITFATLGLGWMGEPFVSHLLEGAFGLLGDGQAAWVSTVSYLVGFALITFLLIVLGELGPRWLAIQHAEKMTLAVASPLHFFFVVFRPIIWGLNRSAGAILHVIGIIPVKEGEVAHSEEELRLILSQGRSISSTGKSISLKAIELRDRTVREVMVPRTNVIFLSTEKTLEQNITIALENQFTRYPLCEFNLDNILGMIHLKDLFKLKSELGPAVTGPGSGSRLLDIKREMLFVPETMPLERILGTFLTKRVLMAIAVDEYGGTAGLVTLENVLEELVGEIRDEFDVEPSMVQKVSDTEFLVDGGMPLHDFARMFDIVPDSKEVVSVSGYALQVLGRVAEKGAVFRIGQWLGTVEAVEKRKVKTLRLNKIQPVNSE